MSQPPALPPTTYIADDGNRYYRNPDGQWILFGHGLPPEALPMAGQLPFIPQAGPGPVAGPSQIPIDPALLPLPRQTEEELAQLRGGQPVSKTAGARRSVKGKGRERETSAPKRGRTKGSANYHPDEVAALLDLIEDELPVGAKGWTKVGNAHRDWAKESGDPARADKSLEAKFKQLVKTSKPTGDAECPPAVERAHAIDSLINEKVGTRDLDDDDIDDHVSASDASDSDKENADDNDDNPPPPAKRPRVSKPAPTPVVHTVNSAPARRSRASAGAGMEVLNRISAGLDPAAQAARATERAAASFQNVQFMSLTQENRDLRAEITALRAQLSEAQRRQYDAERQADRIEQQMHLSRMLGGPFERYPRRRDRWDPSPEHRRREHARHTPQRRFDVQYADGAHSFWGYPGDAPEIDPDRTLISYREVTESPPPRGRSIQFGHRHRRSPMPSQSSRYRSPTPTPSSRHRPLPSHTRVEISVTPTRPRTQLDFTCARAADERAPQREDTVDASTERLFPPLSPMSDVEDN